MLPIVGLCVFVVLGGAGMCCFVALMVGGERWEYDAVLSRSGPV